MAMWVAPFPGYLKVNIDASVFKGSPHFSIGMVLRDHLGELYKARNLRRGGEVSVFEAGSLGVLEAIKWVREIGVFNVKIEYDSLLVVQAILKGSTNYLKVRNILQGSRVLIEDRLAIPISFVKKQANKIAHMLERVPCEILYSNDLSSPWRVFCIMF
ncbi:uncharacterized protein LOC141691625 [Apium graveolens]|uniref:uncharacterized protein LOC141691625 n=1 Tax=Apium graveolens TaxID=4045 RepID=UPI003D7B7535